MNRLFILLTALLIVSCSGSRHDDANDVTMKFNSTWNIYEKCAFDNEENIVYDAIPWGGLVGNFLDKNMPVDLSGYESITFQFAEPLPVLTQIVVANKFNTVGKQGLTSLTCHLDGQDVKAVNEIVLQPSDSCHIIVENVYLTPGTTKWDSTPIWEGDCHFESWSNGFVIKPENLTAAKVGDKIEFIFKTDHSNPDITYWLFKTIYNGTSDTLEGNDSELNEWGCASVSSNATAYRISLTANDIQNIRKYGIFVNGYYINVSQVNLIHKLESHTIQ